MPSGTVFITGATGFIGSHVAKSTLAAGYRVRLSIRKAEQQETLEKILAPHAENAEFLVVPDLSNADALRDALKGVDYVFHLASPMPGKGSDIKTDYVEPAERNTLAILEAAQAQQASIKKVVITASVLSLMPLGSLAYPEFSVAGNTGEVLPVDINSPIPDGFIGHAIKYQASKILAHQAYRDWIKENKPEYNAISFHPTFVLGHSLVQQRAEDVGGMNALFWMSLNSEQPQIPPTFVNVEDVAKSFIHAIENETPSGTEYILSGQNCTWKQVVDFVKKQYPALDVKLTPPFQQTLTVDTSAADKDLGTKWSTYEELVTSVLNQQLTLQGRL